MVTATVPPSLAVDRQEPEPDKLFGIVLADMWRDCFRGTQLLHKMPRDFAQRVIDRIHTDREEARFRSEYIVVEGPIGLPFEEAEKELTVLGLVMLRDAKTLWWCENRGYEFEISHIGEMVHGLIDWYRSLPEDELLSLTNDSVKGFLSLSGLLPEALTTWLDEIIEYGIEFLIIRDLKR